MRWRTQLLDVIFEHECVGEQTLRVPQISIGIPLLAEVIIQKLSGCDE
ncbi:MAG TPA: hypothetical protein VGE32_16595 [Cellvibrio sp.]